MAPRKPSKRALRGVTAASEGGAFGSGRGVSARVGTRRLPHGYTSERRITPKPSAPGRRRKARSPRFRSFGATHCATGASRFPGFGRDGSLRRKLTLMAGTKGVGKTTIGIRVAAHLTQGTTPLERCSRHTAQGTLLVGRRCGRGAGRQGPRAVGVDFDYFGVPVRSEKTERTYEPLIPPWT